MVITISGPAGSGKSHCASSLALQFGLVYHSSGSIFRKIALERGISLEELTAQTETNSEIDLEIDRRGKELAKGGGIIMEGRLSAFFAPEANRLSFYLTAPFEERAKRIAERERIPLKEAEEKTLAREESERRRYKRLYGLDITDLSKYHFVINTALWDKTSEVVLLKRIIETYLESRCCAPVETQCK
jgi:cytidylate kinase